MADDDTKPLLWLAVAVVIILVMVLRQSIQNYS